MRARRRMAVVLCLGLFLFALPAFASIWVTNRTEDSFTLEIQCTDDKATTHRLEASTAANYSLPKGGKGCQITLKEKGTETPLSRIDIEDGGRYEVSVGGK